MITNEKPHHSGGVEIGVLASVSETGRSMAALTPRASAGLDMSLLLREHFDFIWRSLRRLGLDAGHADDAAQEVFLLAAKKHERIEEGLERAFLFGIALRVSADLRKKIARRREVDAADVGEPVDPIPTPDALLDQRRAREMLDHVLDELPEDARVVFVLAELEEMEMHEIATLLGLHQGTVASRLRRGRALFAEAIKRRQARRPPGVGR